MSNPSLLSWEQWISNFHRLTGMLRTGKAKLGNVSLLGEGQCFNLENFFVIYVEDFDGEKFLKVIYFLYLLIKTRW